MKKNILKKFAIAIASTSLALTAPVTMPDAFFNNVQTVEAATVKIPSTVKLNKISTTSYNKIKISWKKASNATNYYIYYRKTGTKKWTKIASVKSSSTSYTHTSSGKYPIIVGQKYDYTVKAYNSKSKKSGKYNTKGLTTKTVPAAVTSMDAMVLSNNTVQLTWTRSFGADKYVVYRKASVNADWQKVATVNGTYYVDKTPVVNQTTYYTVKSYASKTKTYGKYDADGVAVLVQTNTPTPKPTEKPSQPTITPKPTEKPQPTETPATPTPEPTKKPEQPNPSPTPTETPATPTPTEKPQPTPTPTTKPEPNAEQMAQEVIRLVNEERAKAGEVPLQYHAKLQQAAMLRAQELSISYSHRRPDGRNPDTAISEAGVGCPDGENIAYGYGTPKAVMNAWMKSTGHKAAILSPTATHIGVGFYKATNGRYYWVQEFSSDPEKTYSITCNADGGMFADGQEVKTFTFPADMEVEFAKYIPTPVKNGYTFAGWSSYGRIYTGIGLTDNTKITATWTANN